MILLDYLRKYFGYESFRPGQEEIITAIIQNKNVLAILPTGGGKSLCYQIPALADKNFSIVISPLIALMKDQVDSLNKSEEIAAYINSSMNFTQINSVLNKIQQNKIKLLYVSPERLENQGFAERIKQLSPTYIFIDEAHCISEWGHNFRPSYLKIKEFCKFITNSKIHAFTATATPDVRKDIINQLELKNPVIFIKGFERENLHLNVIKASDKKIVLSEIISKNPYPSIIYCSTRKETEALYEYLSQRRINCGYYHAGLSTELRRIVQEDFINDRIKTIIATNAFGMGIDKSDIRLIVHYNMPPSIENYYQEIGRAGRDGQESFVYLFYTKKDKFIQEFLIKNSYPNAEQIKSVYEWICDYGQVPSGIIPQKAIPLDNNFFKILERRGINRLLGLSAIEMLERSGYFKSTSGLFQYYYFKYTIDKNKLKNYIKELKNYTLQEILVEMLREYSSSPFQIKNKLDPEYLAGKLAIEKNSLIENLELLSNSGIIELERPAEENSIYLQKSRINPNYLEIDLSMYEKKLQHQLSKLNEMNEYIDTEKCRSNFILNYFGETETLSKCGKCDKCTGEKNLFSYDTTFIEEKILEVLEEYEFPISKKELTDILTGKASDKFLVLSSYATLTSFSAIEIDQTISELMSKKEIVSENLELTITLKGSARIRPQQNVKETANSGFDIKLKIFNELNQRRKEISQRFNQLPAIICSDTLLSKICELKPQSRAEFLQIEGMNERKLNKFSEDFLEVLRKYKNNDTNLKDSFLQIKEMIQQKYSFEDIGIKLEISEKDLSRKIEALVKNQPSISISHFYKNTEFEMIKLLIAQGINAPTSIKKRINSTISTEKIRLLCSLSSIL